VRARSFANSPDGWHHFLDWLITQRVRRVHACLESTGRYSLGIAGALNEAGHVVSIVNPAQTVGPASVGYAVALSAAGDTAIVGGWGDNCYVGATWVFTRNRGVWSQQGAKLVSTRAVGPAYQGYSVALSADGNTAIVGGANDDNGVGAVWVFTRSGDTWTQQGGKLVAADAAGHAHQGYSVSLSNDGNTALVGGAFDAGNTGAAWVWTRSGDIWTQQGGKLVGAGPVGVAEQGSSVALSRDGTTAIIGGPHDNNGVGAAWIVTRRGVAWVEQGRRMRSTKDDALRNRSASSHPPSHQTG
jgi:hypothetical protein